jgi:hypothetical protein
VIEDPTRRPLPNGRAQERVRRRSYTVCMERCASLVVGAVLASSLLLGAVSVHPAPAQAGVASAPAHGVLATHHSPRVLGRLVSIRIYLIAIGSGIGAVRRIGCGDGLVPVVQRIPPTTTPLTAAIRRLLAGHTRMLGLSVLYNALYRSRLTLQRVRIVNGAAVVRLAGQLRLGGVCDSPRVRAQLRQTVLQFHTVRTVSIYVNNVPLRKLLSGKG